MKAVRINRLKDDTYYTQNDAIKQANISYKTFVKYFGDIYYLRTNNNFPIYKGSDINQRANAEGFIIY